MRPGRVIAAQKVLAARASEVGLLGNGLTGEEERIDDRTGALRFDISLLTNRFVQMVDWATTYGPFATLPIGVFGASPECDVHLWMYAMTVTDGSGNVSPMGPPDLATAVSFTDWTIVNQSTTIKAAHVNELRAAIACVRTFAGLSPYSYTNTIAAGQLIRASDIEEMRTALAQARSTIGLPAISFVDPTLTPSATLVHAMHIGQMRAGTN